MAEAPAVESKPTRRHFILLRDLTDSQQMWQAGSLWSDTDRMVNGRELQLRPVSGEDDSEGSLRVVCSDVSELTPPMLGLLVAVREPQQRLMLFTDATWFSEGIKLQIGDPVRVTQNGRLLAGVLCYKGPMPKSPGTHFGVELLPRFAGQGTTDGVFQRKRFFICDEDCAVFVPLGKIRLRGGDGDDDAVGDTPALHLQLSERVAYLSDNVPCMATVRWFGYLPEEMGYELIAGVEFDNPIGKGTGKFRGRHIFHTRKHHASLIPLSELIREGEVSVPCNNVMTARQPDIASIRVGQEPSVSANDCQLTVGSRVEVLHDPIRRGVIRWIGDLQEGGRRIAGIEMADEDSSCYTRGTFGRRQIFPCSEQRAFFVSLQKCRPASTTVAHPKQSARLETGINAFCGDRRGIHGSASSCHMDVVLFVMFAFRGPFDDILEQQTAVGEDTPPNDHAACSKLKVLVDSLRTEHYVPNDMVTQLHDTLNTLRPLVCIDRQGRDPSAFLSFICREVLKAAPFVTLGTGQDEHVYQLVSCVESDTTDPPTVQLLLEESLRRSDSNLCDIPTTLILKTPRDEGGCTRVLPTLHLDITDLLAGHDRCCHRCRHPAQVECSQCCEELSGGDRRQMTFCESCFAEHHSSGDMHYGQRIIVDVATLENRTILELFAIITKEDETCASFVKPPGGIQLPWLRFEGVSCREDLLAEPSVPVVRQCQDFDKWLSEEHRQSLVDQTADVPSEIYRVLSSASLWFYRKMAC